MNEDWGWKSNFFSEKGDQRRIKWVKYTETLGPIQAIIHLLSIVAGGGGERIKQNEGKI